MARNTSYTVKKKYEKAHGWAMKSSCIDKVIAEQFKKICDTNGDSYNSILVDGIREYIALNK